MELWKEIEGFENYQVSSWGRVRSANGILKPYKNKKGYLKIGLTKDGKSHKKRVNRLVAMAFIDNPNELPFVDHIDGNKENNHVSNLEWTDRSRNVKHSFDTGLKRPHRWTETERKQISDKVKATMRAKADQSKPRGVI